MSDHHQHAHDDASQAPADEKAQDKVALRASQAGMRFIAQTHIYNQADVDRLRTFIEDSYHDDQLAQQSAEARLTAFRQMYADVGRVRVKQVMAAHEHHVIVIVETEKSDAMLYTEVKVEDDYPHKITYFMNAPLKAISN
jgi:hypothetical protein